MPTTPSPSTGDQCAMDFFLLSFRLHLGKHHTPSLCSLDSHPLILIAFSLLPFFFFIIVAPNLQKRLPSFSLLPTSCPHSTPSSFFSFSLFIWNDLSHGWKAWELGQGCICAGESGKAKILEWGYHVRELVRKPQQSRKSWSHLQNQR